jgi:hypothetical protein
MTSILRVQHAELIADSSPSIHVRGFSHAEVAHESVDIGMTRRVRASHYSERMRVVVSSTKIEV